MRTTDPEQRPLGPIVGEKVTPRTPEPSEKRPMPVGPSGIITGPDGRIRTIYHPRGSK
jgi:hypothetical protein